jgi:adenine-specific DNA-methyltransferase
MPILQWLNRDKTIHAAQHVPYRLLKEEPEFSYGDPSTQNMLIQGDNLDALKALLPYYAGKVKCIFIDPPYNTESAFEHYEDNLEHTKWLEIMYPRLELLQALLAENGTIWIMLDDHEIHYLKVIMDEVFGRNNFLNQVTVKMKQTSGASGGGEDVKLKKNVEYILCYTKNRNLFSKFNSVYEEENLMDVIDDMRSEEKSWKYTRVLTSLGRKTYLKSTTDGTGNEIKIFTHEGVIMKTIKDIMLEESLSEEECYLKYLDKIFRDTNAQSSIRTRVLEATKDDGNFFSIEYTPRSGRSKDKITTLFYKGNNRDLIAWLSDIAHKKGNKIIKHEKVSTYWDGFPLNNLTKEGSVHFANGKKPEKLIQRILSLASNETDLILDSFLGSGTTAAVAHKMNRRYIGIEMGEHSKTHCAMRLKKVIDGEQGGISKEVNWEGGGGFRFYKLGEPIFNEYGQINPDIRFAHLAAHIWFSETRLPYMQKKNSPLLGIHEETAYYLLYNGILGDKRPDAGNVLTSKIFESLPKHDGPKVIYGETTRMSPARLKENQITFKQTPYDIKAR